MTYASPIPSRMTRDQVEEFALKVREALQYETGGSIKDAIEKIGGKISYDASASDDHESGSLVAKSIDDFQIKLSPHTSIERDNFTIAHELGHLALHFNDQPMRATRNPGKDEASTRAEWEANWFAAAFLMPREEFKKTWLDMRGNVTAIAAHFSVSVQAASVRISTLNLS